MDYPWTFSKNAPQGFWRFLFATLPIRETPLFKGFFFFLQKSNHLISTSKILWPKIFLNKEKFLNKELHNGRLNGKWCQLLNRSYWESFLEGKIFGTKVWHKGYRVKDHFIVPYLRLFRKRNPEYDKICHPNCKSKGNNVGRVYIFSYQTLLLLLLISLDIPWLLENITNLNCTESFLIQQGPFWNSLLPVIFPNDLSCSSPILTQHWLSKVPRALLWPLKWF